MAQQIGSFTQSATGTVAQPSAAAPQTYLAWWNHKGVRFKSGRPVRMLTSPAKRQRHDVQAEAYAIGLAIGRAKKAQRERMKAA